MPFPEVLTGLGLTVQPIDYNSSILAALLSGINLACLETHVGKEQDGGASSPACSDALLFSQLSSLFHLNAKRHFQQRLTLG